MEECIMFSKEKVSNDTETLDYYITQHRNITQVHARFIELFVEECMEDIEGNLDALTDKMDDIYEKAKNEDFDWQVKDWSLLTKGNEDETNFDAEEDDNNKRIEL